MFDEDETRPIPRSMRVFFARVVSPLRVWLMYIVEDGTDAMDDKVLFAGRFAGFPSLWLVFFELP